MPKLSFIFFLALTACQGCHKARPKPEPVDPDSVVKVQYAETLERMQGLIDNQGYLYSLDINMGHHDQGNSVLYGSLAVTAMPCDQGGTITDAIISMLNTLNGGIWRHPLQADEASLDDAIGLYRMVSHRVMACLEFARWRPVMALHKEFQRLHANVLNPVDKTALEAEFDYTRDLLFYKLGLGGNPNPSRKKAFIDELGTWAFAVSVSKKAAYRDNLALISLQTLEELDGPVDAAGRDKFCENTKSVDIPTIDHWCGRSGLKDYLDSFVFNQWHYRHERSGSWESPDGHPGDQTPAVDRLVGLSQFYKL